MTTIRIRVGHEWHALYASCGQWGTARGPNDETHDRYLMSAREQKIRERNGLPDVEVWIKKGEAR